MLWSNYPRKTLVPLFMAIDIILFKMPVLGLRVFQNQLPKSRVPFLILLFGFGMPSISGQVLAVAEKAQTVKDYAAAGQGLGV